MPIIWVDDDGTGTVGTIINNAAKTALYNEIDASCAFVNAANVFLANQNISAPAPTIVFVNSAAAADAKRIYLANEGPQFAFRVVNDAFGIQSTPLQLTRTGDAVVGRDVYEKGRAAPMGHWTTVPFNAGMFAAGGAGTWTVGAGNVLVFEYAIVGKTLWLSVFLSGTTIGGTPTTLRISLLGATGCTLGSIGGAPAFFYGSVAGSTACSVNWNNSTPNEIMITRDLVGTSWAAQTFTISFVVPIRIA
jgi:hypothetical protein